MQTSIPNCRLRAGTFRSLFSCRAASGWANPHGPRLAGLFVFLCLLLAGLLPGMAPPARAQTLDLLRSAGGSAVPGTDEGNATAIDAAGNVYVTGSFEGTANFSGTTLTSAGGKDIFVAKYSASGVLQWARRAGGTSDDVGNGIAVDGSGVYLTGRFEDIANFNTPSASGSNEITSEGGSSDIFVAKYDLSGTPQWQRRAGGTSTDYGFGLAVDGSGVYLTGSFQGTANFNTLSDPASNTIASAGSQDIFVAKYDLSGVPQWQRRAGGTITDAGFGLVVDGSGVYLTGFFVGTANFNTPSNSSSNTIVSAGSQDIFVAKYDLSGVPQWQRRAGGTNTDYSYGLAVDGSGVYLTGSFSGMANFNTPSDPTSNTLVSAGSNDIFVAKYDLSGTRQWQRRAGGISSDVGSGIAVDGSGVYLTGYFQGTANFNTPSASGSNQITSAGDQDIFVAKYNLSGTPQWQQPGGAFYSIGDDRGIATATDAAGNVYVTGYFSGIANFSGTTLTSAGGYDIFVAKYNASGVLQWARRAGGELADLGYGLAVDGSGIYLTGYFQGTANFNTPSASGSNQITSAGGVDIFVAKYDLSGVPQWQRRAGGTGFDAGSGLAVDGSGVYLTGTFSGTANFNTPSDPASNTIASEGGLDIFVAKYDLSGVPQWQRRAGATTDDVGSGIAVDGSGVYLTGHFRGTANFNTPSNPASTTLTSAGGLDIFVAKYDLSGTPQWQRRAGGTSNDDGYGLAVDGSGVYLTGSFGVTANFNTPSDPASNTIVSAGSSDIFVAKYDLSGTPQWQRRAGGTSDDQGRGIAVHGSGLYLTGAFEGTANFNTPSASGSNELTSAGESDMFLARFVVCSPIAYVTPNGAGSMDGSSWANAYAGTALQTAIDAVSACGGGQVWVAAGTYTPGTSRNSSFALRNGVAIYGGFAGSETALTGRNPGLNPTVLSGEIGLAGLSDNCYHVIFNTGLDNTAILDGFIIAAGNADGSGQDDAGGGMRSNSSGSSPIIGNPVIRNCLFRGNSAIYGGAFYSQNNGNPTLTNCGFLNNTATIAGGAIFVYNDSPALTNGSFQGNTAPINAGGAIGSDGGNAPILTNCVLFGNDGANTIFNGVNQVSATYSLFDTDATGYSGTTGNLTTSTTPFVSPTSLALVNNAPAINTGDPATTTLTLGTAIDLAGNPRVFGGRVDMGAYELQTAPAPFIASFDASPNPLCVGNVVTFTATVGNVTGTYNFTLSNGTGPLSGTATGATFSQTLTAAGSGSGTQTLTYTLTIGANATTTAASTTLNVGNHPDYPALVDLYTSTSGVSWHNSTNWLTSCDPCNTVDPWFGVTCVSGRVVRLDLPNNNLTGSIPASLSALTNLFRLHLVRNQLSGNIPASLSALTNLQEIYLSVNQLSGSIPNSLSVLTNLHDLWLNNSQLSGNIPDGLAALTNLNILNLQNNRLSGSIPSSLSTLTQLGLLSLHNNQLSGSIPNSLSALTQLVELSLHTNQLSGSIPGSLSALTRLQLLNLHNNQLSGSIPASLESLTNLQELTLQNNQLSGCYPASLSFLCGQTTDFSNNTALPGGGSPASFSAFCATGAGSDGFVALATASQSTATVGTVVSLSSTGGPTATFSWQAPTGATLSSPATTTSVSATLTTPGEKTFTVTVSFGSSCSSTATVSVTVPAPTLSGFAPTAGTVCAGSVATFTATIGNISGPYNFTLSNGTGPVSGTATGATFSQTLTAAGSGQQSFTLTIGANATTTAASSTLNVAVLPVAGISVPANLTVTCTTPTLTLTATGGSLYRWENNTFTASRTINASGTYSVTVTNASGCSALTAVTLTVTQSTAAPTVSISASSGTLTCAVTSITLTATSSTTNLLWSNAATTQSITVNSVGTYSVTATGANGCSAVSNTVTIGQNNTAPTGANLSASNSGTLTCSVQTLTLTATATGATSYSFSGPSGMLVGSNNTRPVSASGLYSVTITGANSCTTSASTTVYSNTAAPSVSINPTSGTLTCASPSLTLTASTSGTGLRWSTTETTPSIVVSTSGTYSVTATAANGCTSTTSVTIDSDQAGASAVPTLSASSSVVCEGSNVQVVATVSGLPTGMQWYRNGQIVSGQTSATLTLSGVQATQAGSYVLVLTGACSVTSGPFNLTVNPIPTVTILVPDNATMQGSTISLPAPLMGVNFRVLGGTQYERLIVLDRINGFEIRAVDTNTNGAFSVTRTGPFRLTVTDGNGCRRTVEGVIETR